MARLPKYPKQPKQSSSLQVWARYLERCKAVAQKRKAMRDAPKKKDSIKAQVSKLKMSN